MYRIKRVPFILWHIRHHYYHLFIGLAYAWFLRELWHEFNGWYIFLSLFGSEVIDLDHVVYFFAYGRHEPYAKEVRRILKQGQIGTLVKYLASNHKQNTGLATHNVYFLSFFLSVGVVASFFDWKASVVFFGAIVLHLIFDMWDDLIVLGYVNENWKRLKRKKAIEAVES